MQRLTDATSSNHISEEELHFNLVFAALGFTVRQSEGILGIKTNTLVLRFNSLLRRFDQPTVGMLVVHLIHCGLLSVSDSEDLPQVMRTRYTLFHDVSAAMKSHGLDATLRAHLLAGIRTPTAQGHASVTWKVQNPPNYVRAIRAIIGGYMPTVGCPPVFMAAAAASAGEL